ncbi:MAG: Fe-S cluster assembly protein SufD [Terriglobia bacterium]
MIQVTDEKELYLSSFADLQRTKNGLEPAWLKTLRQTAIDSFEQKGFPSVHDEEWRFSNIAPIVKTPFKPATPQGHKLTEKKIQPWSLGSWENHRLVFVNGAFSAELSSLSSLPPGVTLSGLSQAMNTHSSIIQSFLARNASTEPESFAALNTALFQDGPFIHIPRGVVLEKPIHVLFVMTADSQDPVVSHPRSLLIAESSSQVQVVESYVGLGRGVYFNNALSEIIAGENARVEHYHFQREKVNAFHVSNFQGQVARDAHISNFNISLGGAFVRNNVSVVLNGEGAEATLNGFYLVNGTQHVDNHTSIDHAKPHCNSFELYKGILDGRARAVFNGRIIVRPDAQKTDSKQTNKNLILSEEALVNTNPQLEIYADDVKCTHGATIGQLDAESIFYLRSRGIGYDEARHLLTYAFASELNSQIQIEPLRAELESILFTRLAEGRESKA